jgi:hypothetical protein
MSADGVRGPEQHYNTNSSYVKTPKTIRDVKRMSMPEEEIVKRALDELHLRVSESAKGELVPPLKPLPNGNNVVTLKCTQGSTSYEVEIELTKRGKFVDLRTK